MENELQQIVTIQVNGLQKLLEERGLEIELTPEAEIWLANEGYDPAYGARPLKRVIQRKLQDPLAMAVLEGRFADGDVVKVSVGEDGLVFDVAA